MGPSTPIEAQLTTWLGKVCKTVFSTSFQWLQQNKLSPQKTKSFCSESILRNVLHFSQKYPLSPSNFQLINTCLQKQLLPYFLLKYPQTEARDSSKGFVGTLIERDMMVGGNQGDLVSRSGCYFQGGGGVEGVMRFVNFVVGLTGAAVEGQPAKTLLQCFQEDVEGIFKLVESQSNKIAMLKFDPKNPTKMPQILETLVESINKGDNKDKDKEKEKEKERLQHEYRQKVRSYTHYSINSKLSPNERTFSQYEIGNGDFYLRNSAIMRVVTKWCEELQKYFTPSQILQRQTCFRMKDGSQNFLNNFQMQILNLMLQRQKRIIDTKIQLIQNDIYSNESHFANAKIRDCYAKFGEGEGVVGQFTAVMFKANQNYLINYLNFLIQAINNAAQCFGRFRDYQSYLSGEREVEIRFLPITSTQTYSEQTLERIQSFISQHPLSSKRSVSKTPQLITFKVGDLLRCKCTSKQNEIIALYKHMERISYEKPQLFKIVRVKNRLGDANRDILINFMYRGTLLAEMQLGVVGDTSRFIECSNWFNHYLYELKRAGFGPVMEMCSIWASQDLRASFYLQKQAQLNKRNTQNLIRSTDPTLCCTKIKNTSLMRLPFTCTSCRHLYLRCSFSEKHVHCKKCNRYTCFLCQVQTFPKQQMRKLLPEVSSEPTVNMEQIQFLKEFKEGERDGTGIVNLKAKKRELVGVHAVWHEGYLYLFDSKQKQGADYSRNLIYKNKGKKLNPNFLKQNLIIRLKGPSPWYTHNQASLSQFIPDYLHQCQRTQNKQIFLMKKQLNLKKLLQILSSTKFPQFLSTKSLNLSQNNFSSLGDLPVIFPNILSLILTHNDLPGLEEPSLGNWRALKYLYISHNWHCYRVSRACPVGCFSQFRDIDLASTSQSPQYQPNSLPQLKNLKISDNEIQEIEQGFYKLKKLKILQAKNNQIEKISDQLCKMRELRQISFSMNYLRQLPDQFGELPMLVSLAIVSQESIERLPQSFGKLQRLTNLDMGGTSISELPQSFGNLKSLTNFHVGSSQLRTLPQSFGNLQSLSEMYAGYTNILTLPQSFGSLKQLTILYLRNSSLAQLPHSFGKLQSLTELRINDCQLAELPQNFGQLVNLRQLYMGSNRGLKILPKSFPKLRSLHTLDIPLNSLTSLPENFGDLHRLQSLNLNQSKYLSNLPASFAKLHELTYLNLNYSQLDELPLWIGNLDCMKELFIRGITKLRRLPDTLVKLEILRVLDLSEIEGLIEVMQIIGKLEMLQFLCIDIQNLDTTPPPIQSLQCLKQLQICTPQHNTRIPNRNRKDKKINNPGMLQSSNCALIEIKDSTMITAYYFHKYWIAEIFQSCSSIIVMPYFQIKFNSILQILYTFLIGGSYVGQKEIPRTSERPKKVKASPGQEMRREADLDDS